MRSMSGAARGPRVRATLEPARLRRVPPDRQLLRALHGWRLRLARSVHAEHPALHEAEVAGVVQALLDRLIFLRVAEDRRSLPADRLAGAVRSWRAGAGTRSLAAALLPLFRQVNAELEGELFAPHPCERIRWDSSVVADIIEVGLVPRDFTRLGVELLGSVHERSLEKTLRFSGREVRLEDEPEVRRTHGVFYTPRYVVDELVEHALGPVIDGKSPAQLEGIRILDPACGSGAFLLGAFDHLVRAHQRAYARGGGPADGPSPFTDGSTGARRLTLQEKARILKSCIFGVDLDPRAVAITRMSLCARLLEDEPGLSSRRSLLPALAPNIRCGNAIVDPGVRQGVDERERETIDALRPFAWESDGEGFGPILRSGGFDVVIGNPPYGAELSPLARRHLARRHPLVADFESSQYFIARALELCRPGGSVAFIVPNTLLLNVHARPLRTLLAGQATPYRVADLSAVEVFEGASVRTVIPYLRQGASMGDEGSVELVRFTEPSAEGVRRVGTVALRALRADDGAWRSFLGAPAATELQRKLKAGSDDLDAILEVSQGLIPYDRYRGQDEATIRDRRWHAEHEKDASYRRELKGGDVGRYRVQWNGRRWIRYGPWLAAPRRPAFFTEPRLLVREITDPRTGLLHVAYTSEELYNNPAIINCIARDRLACAGARYSLHYVLALANSRLLAFHHFASSPKARKGVFPKILVADVRKLPIRRIDFEDLGDVQQHDELVRLAREMTALGKQLQEADDADRVRIVAAQRAADEEIDRLVYRLYGITGEEQASIELAFREDRPCGLPRSGRSPPPPLAEPSS
jgi:hypothetical protein